MKILLIHQYYKTPQEGGAIRSYYIAEYLAEQGHEVHVITAYNKKRKQVVQTGKVTVHYLPVYYTNHLSFLSRIHAFYRFVRKAIKLVKQLHPADLNYVITTPLSTGLIALYAKKRLGIPYIFEVGDLWPEAPVQLGVIKNRVLKALAYWLEKASYQAAQSIVALSPDIKAAILNKVPDKRIEVVTNMADTRFFSFEPKNPGLVAKYVVQDKFVITYTGAAGLANHLEYLLEAAEAVRDDPHIHFIVAGEGALWEATKNQSAKRSLNNITFIKYLSKEGVKELLNIADAAFISFKNAPVLATGSPNKFFDGLAAGKLIILNFEGWIKNLVDQHQCGFSYPPDSPQVFREKLLHYLDNSNRLLAAQQNARRLAATFTPAEQLAKLKPLIA